MMNPFGAIWITPADYRAAVDGTPFAIQHETQTGWYRRQVYRQASRPAYPIIFPVASCNGMAIRPASIPREQNPRPK